MAAITYLDFDLSIEPIAKLWLPLAALALEDFCYQISFLWR